MRLSFATDKGAASRAALGLIVLEADETIEPELRQMLAIDGVALYHSRIKSAPEVTPETLARMHAEIPAATSLLPPTVGVVAYACTSGATVIGEAAVAAAIHLRRPEAKATNPLTAIKAACHAKGIRRLGFVSPYVAEVSAAIRQALEEDGIEIAGFGSFEQSEERTVARITPQSTLEAIIQVGQAAPCDAVLAACTNLRTAPILAEAERQLAKPVLSSNQALAWHMLHLAGLGDGAGK